MCEAWLQVFVWCLVTVGGLVTVWGWFLCVRRGSEHCCNDLCKSYINVLLLLLLLFIITWVQPLTKAEFHMVGYMRWSKKASEPCRFFAVQVNAGWMRLSWHFAAQVCSCEPWQKIAKTRLQPRSLSTSHLSILVERETRWMRATANDTSKVTVSVRLLY